jgi:hypothetical protein
MPDTVEINNHIKFHDQIKMIMKLFGILNIDSISDNTTLDFCWNNVKNQKSKTFLKKVSKFEIDYQIKLNPSLKIVDVAEQMYNYRPF